MIIKNYAIMFFIVLIHISTSSTEYYKMPSINVNSTDNDTIDNDDINIDQPINHQSITHEPVDFKYRVNVENDTNIGNSTYLTIINRENPMTTFGPFAYDSILGHHIQTICSPFQKKSDSRPGSDIIVYLTVEILEEEQQQSMNDKKRITVATHEYIIQKRYTNNGDRDRSFTTPFDAHMNDDQKKQISAFVTKDDCKNIDVMVGENGQLKSRAKSWLWAFANAWI